MRTGGGQPIALAACVRAAAAGLGLALAGCASGPDPIDLPLVYEHEVAPDLITHMFPIFLSGWEEKPLSDETRGYGLWPLFHYVREGREVEWGFLGAPFYRKRIDHRGFVDFDWLVPPVVFGHSVDEGSYLSVFPFGGTLKGLLGKSYVATVLFPLYLYAEDNRGVGPGGDIFISHHVLFPFINWVHGHGRSGFRVFPFYAHYERKDLEGRPAYERTWVLWPFFTHQRNNLNTSRGEAGAQEMWFLFPFYGTAHGPKTSQWTVLWPLVRYYENRGSQFGGPGWELHVTPLFPLVTIERRREGDRTDIWPFYGTRTRFNPITLAGGYEKYDRTFILWPLLRWEHQETDRADNRRFWAAPFFWHFTYEDKAKGVRKEEIKVWPFFRYKKWPDGRVTVNVFSPLWFQDPEGAFERIYNPLFRIYEHGRQPDGDDRRLYAWGLVQQYENDRRSETWVHPLLYWNKVAKDDTERDDYYFFGLFQYHRRGKERALRFFWLPEFPSWTSD